MKRIETVHADEDYEVKTETGLVLVAGLASRGVRPHRLSDC